LYLTDDEKRMLDGVSGRVKQVSMKYIVDYANALGADQLCKVTKAQLFSGNHLYLKAINEEDIDRAISLMHFATKTPLSFNHDVECFSQTCGMRMDTDRWEEQGFEKQDAVENEAYLRRYMDAGISMTNTCCGYLSGFITGFGEHYVCTESHAIIFMNSIWGARGNADGIPASFCSAMCGRTAYWGNHVTDQRYANGVVRVEAKLESLHDWDSLGFVFGKKSPAFSIPYVELPESCFYSVDAVRSAFATMATTGGVELCHIGGKTPEAQTRQMAFGSNKSDWDFVISDKDIKEAREFLCDKTNDRSVDFVHLGCPHYSLEQIQYVARFLDGKKINDNTRLHIWTAPSISTMAEKSGFKGTIEKSGAKLLSGSCALVSGRLPKGAKNIAFDSAKQTNPKKSDHTGSVFYGDVNRCLNAALHGRWE
jgi:cis-L-3-hydroxyproline dehydratase